MKMNVLTHFRKPLLPCFPPWTSAEVVWEGLPGNNVALNHINSTGSLMSTSSGLIRWLFAPSGGWRVFVILSANGLASSRVCALCAPGRVVAGFTCFNSPEATPHISSDGQSASSSFAGECEEDVDCTWLSAASISSFISYSVSCVYELCKSITLLENCYNNARVNAYRIALLAVL